MGAGQLAVIPGVPAAKSSFQATGDATAGVYVPMQNGGTTPGSEGSHSPRPRPAATARGHGGGGDTRSRQPLCSLAWRLPPCPPKARPDPCAEHHCNYYYYHYHRHQYTAVRCKPPANPSPRRPKQEGGGVTPMSNIFKFVTGLLVRIPTNFSARFARRIPPTCHIVVH